MAESGAESGRGATAGSGATSPAGRNGGSWPAEIGRGAGTRASDRERDAVVTRVQDAFAQGRLDDVEFDERTRAAPAVPGRGPGRFAGGSTCARPSLAARSPRSWRWPTSPG
jgi:hypothetical protein